MDDEILIDDSYKGQVDAEGLLLTHLNRVCQFRDVSHKQYCSSIETLILVCPRKVRDKALQYMNDNNLQHGDYSNITLEKLLAYDRLLMFVNEQLETKEKMIWKKRSIRTYD